MARACANCGTEVDDDALFCPTCGEPIDRGSEPDLPPAPDWPSATPAPPVGSGTARPAMEPEAPDELDVTRAAPVVDGGASVPEAAEEQPPSPAVAEPDADASVPPWRRGAAYRAEAPPEPAASAPIPPRPGALRPEGIIRPPTTLSGWLIGAGALVAVVGILLPWVTSASYTGGWGLASGINLLFFLVLLGVLAVIFLPHLVPEVPQRNLALLAVALVGAGIGLDRLGLPLTGSGAMVFLIGMLVFAGGAFVAQLGLDRDVGGQLP